MSPKAAKRKKVRTLTGRRPTSARLLKNRPVDPDEKKPGELLTDPEAPAKKPRQARLPEMEDPKIEELETAAESYATIRDQRMALTPQEKKLKDDLHAAMIRLGKKTYRHEGVEIEVIAKEETVRVRIKKEQQAE